MKYFKAALFISFAILTGCSSGEVYTVDCKYFCDPIEISYKEKIIIDDLCEFKIIGTLFTDSIKNPKDPDGDSFVLPSENSLILDVIMEIKPYRSLIPSELFRVFENEKYCFESIVKDTKTGGFISSLLPVEEGHKYIIHYYRSFYIEDIYSDRSFTVYIKPYNNSNPVFKYSVTK